MLIGLCDACNGRLGGDPVSDRDGGRDAFSPDGHGADGPFSADSGKLLPGDGTAGGDGAFRDATEDVEDVADGGVPDVVCAADSAGVVIDAGYFPSCAQNPCGSGQFCVNQLGYQGDAVSFGKCASVPPECSCPETCACIGTWWPPGMMECVIATCVVDHGRVVVGCHPFTTGR